MFRVFLFLLLTLHGMAYAQTRTLTVTQEPARVALVIGNNAYRAIPGLEKAASDAISMGDALKKIGYDTTVLTDASQRKMNSAINRFVESVSAGGEGVFFFAGHGVQINNQNYLLPVDFENPRNEADVADQAVSVQAVQDKVAEARAKFALLVIDACRDNPLPKKAGRSLGSTRGLAQASSAQGQMVVFSAGANQQALDKLGDNDSNPNGLFTREFLPMLSKPGVSVRDAVLKVRDSVYALAKGVDHEQFPAVYDQVMGDYYFIPPSVDAVATSKSAPENDEATDAAERAAWALIEAAPSREGLENYLAGIKAKKWKGLFLEQAATRLKALPSIKLAALAAENAAQPGEAAYWIEVSNSNNPANYEAYLRTYPNGVFVPRARAWLESDLWQQTTAAATPERYDAFLKAYPDGAFAGEAKAWLVDHEQRLQNFVRAHPSGSTFKDCPDCPDMVVIPAGSYQMGASDGEPDEKPVHEVQVPMFAVARTEVTVAQFRAFVESAGYRTTAEQAGGCRAYEDTRGGTTSNDRSWRSPGFEQIDTQPAVCLSWEDARAYVQWLTLKTGVAYRLPSEAEWEYAARAGQRAAWPWGDDMHASCKDANIADRTARKAFPGWLAANCTDGAVFTQPVARYQANAFGLYDMIGNAWEWTGDCYRESDDPSQSTPAAFEGTECKQRVLRGGSWNFKPHFARLAKRFGLGIQDRSNGGGFRPVRAIP